MLSSEAQPAVQQYRDAQILSLHPIIRKTANRFVRRGMVNSTTDSDDLESAGWIAAIRAVDEFDPQRGVPIEAYAGKVIAGAMLNEFRKMDPISERTRTVVRHGNRIMDQLRSEMKCEPTTADIEQLVPGYTTGLVRVRRFPYSLDSETISSEGVITTLHDFVPANTNIAETVVTHEETSQLHASIHKLEDRRRRVIVEHYFQDRPLRMIAKDLGLSGQRISQLHLKALSVLRASRQAA